MWSGNLRLWNGFLSKKKKKKFVVDGYLRLEPEFNLKMSGVGGYVIYV